MQELLRIFKLSIRSYLRPANRVQCGGTYKSIKQSVCSSGQHDISCRNLLLPSPEIKSTMPQSEVCGGNRPVGAVSGPDNQLISTTIYAQGD
ncbi:hypothetical protein Mapa_008478 [Marchantia paleacea]|nr:hypothetical protein Mapa_008478 [Marchantia paleacea]